MAPKRNVFLGKNFADPTIKKYNNIFYPISIDLQKNSMFSGVKKFML
jgi:hypothetical protein